MRKVEKLVIEYCGYANPETNDELEFECAGLETAICEIKARIARLRQAQKLNILFEASDENKQKI